MLIRRAQHWTDIPVVGKNRRRIMKNWCNFREPNRSWRESNPEIEDDASVPDNWEGNYDFHRRSLRGPMQAFMGDMTDVDNPAMVGCRLADRPDAWLNMKPMNVNPGSVAQIVSPRVIRWPNIWDNAGLRYRVVEHKLEKTIRLTAPGHPAVFRFTLRVADGMSVKFEGNGARILDARGVECMRLVEPWGKDGSTVNPDTLDGSNPVRVRMQEGQSKVINGCTYQVVKLIPHPDDLADAIYPVEIDPTVEITGTIDIEDTSLVSAGPDGNYGGSIDLHLSFLASYRALIRISSSSIPGGTITGFRLKMYSTAGFETHVFFIADANDWVEGTAQGGQQTGSCCWNYCKFSDQNWAGSPGCGTSGTDYDTDGSPPSHTPIIGWNTFTLKPEWPPLWRDGARVANGMLFFPQVGGWFGWKSTENAGNPLYFEVDYEEVEGSPIAAMLPRRIQ